jgi:hypothetical protein
MVGQTHKIGRDRGFLIRGLLTGEEGHGQSLRLGLGANRRAFEVPAFGHTPPLHGQKRQQGQIHRVQRQVGGALKLQQGRATILALSR